MTETTQRNEIGSKFDQNLSRIAVGAYQDMQEMRKASMNRVRDIVRKKNEDIPFDQTEEEKEDRSFDKKYKDENLPELIQQMHDEGKLTEREFEYLESMLQAGQQAEKLENEYNKVMEITAAEPLYREWLTHVTGVSTTLTARLMNHIGYAEDAERVRNLWSYAGLTPDSSREKGEQLSYNPDLKTTAWTVADTMVKMGDKSRYRTEFYDPYKEKQLDRMDQVEEAKEEGYEIEVREIQDHNNTVPVTVAVKDGEEKQLFKGTAPESRGHANNRALRYLAKKFLKHYWAIARDIKGLDVPEEYIIAYGGHKNQENTWENPFHAKQQLQGE